MPRSLVAIGSLVLAVAGPAGFARGAGDEGRRVADFSLTDCSGRIITRDDLRGNVWIASFIFTRCGGPCPRVTAQMARLQDDLGRPRGLRLVTFSVDPEYDTPAVLRDYAHAFGADPDRWLFLSGPRDEIYDLIYHSFQLGVQKNPEPGHPPTEEVIHSTKLVLVDEEGRIRGYFDSTGPTADLAGLERAVRGLLWRHRLPELNACLNASSACLLLLGYVAVRRRRIRLHAACMLTALGLSALFLSFYLYYHLLVRGGRHTPFAGTGASQVVYRAVLLTHTALAAVAAPLAPVTAFLGLNGRLRRHVRLARWTLPVWLYVSFTGVVVYWMLYRLYPAP